MLYCLPCFYYPFISQGRVSMKKKKSAYLKNTLVPCLALASAIGVITGGAIFLFQLVSSEVIHLSEKIYALVRADARYLPLLILCAAALGLLAALILTKAKECRGGGIPTAVASMRGLVPLRWVQSVFVLFFSSMLTFLGGVPLGNEGPSVLMGTAIGKGTSETTGKRHLAWERYCMTGGASAGFALATGAPVCGVLFALEEAHRRFSVSLLVFSSVSVFVGSLTQSALCRITGITPHVFRFATTAALPLRYLFLPLIIGLACGGFAVLITRLYSAFKALQKKKYIPLGFIPKLVTVFAVTALLGFFSQSFIGTGQSLIESLQAGEGIWYMLLLALLVRAILMTFANGEGVSGGVFVPTLAFGALIAALLFRSAFFIGLIPAEYGGLMIAVGMAAFLAASARIPMTALVFSLEMLGGFHNTLSVGIAVTAAFMIVEFSGKVSFTDTIIESKTAATHEGRVPLIINAFVTVGKDSFADGKELRDLLLPPTSAVLSIEMQRPVGGLHSASEICAGDVLHLHYCTYDPEHTMEFIEALFGPQVKNEKDNSHLGSETHIVPED